MDALGALVHTVNSGLRLNIRELVKRGCACIITVHRFGGRRAALCCSEFGTAPNYKGIGVNCVPCIITVRHNECS